MFQYPDELQKAAEFLHRYGNVGGSTEDLLSVAPTEQQLQAALDHCQRVAESAAAVIREQFGMPQPFERHGRGLPI